MTKKYILFFIFFFLFINIDISIYARNVSVFSFGAKGDGKTIETEAIQAAIDSCHNTGGGCVVLSNGVFLSGTLLLKSHVELHIESGAILRGSTYAKDYKIIGAEDSITLEKYDLGKTLIYSENETNISISGNGLIDGNGEILSQKKEIRAHIIHFNNCSDIKVKDITLYNGSLWIQKYMFCNNLYIDGVTVDSNENKDINSPRYADTPGRNTDGCNIVDSRNVRISNCDIFSGDDGIVVKSFAKNKGCRNITISNCIISTNASGIKIGTETAGTFEDIVINNCTVYDTRLGGIELMIVDGGKMEKVIVSNISLNNIKGSAIFVRLGDRGRKYRNHSESSVGQLKNILIQNIYGTKIGKYGCSITGIPTAFVEDIVLNNINLSFTGGNDPLFFEGYPHKPVKQLTIDNVPEDEKAYPRCDMFGKLPAYGFYIRHTKGIELNGIKLTFEKNDLRPAIVADDLSRLFINNCWLQGTEESECLIYLRNTKQGIIQSSGSLNNSTTFLKLSGLETSNIQIKSTINEKYLLDSSVSVSEIKND